MDRYTGGDDEAFAELYQGLAPRLFTYLRKQTGDKALAEDLLQQTMLQIHCQRGRFQRGAEVAPWAFAIARRFLIDHIRQKNREQHAREQLTSVEPDPETPTDDMVHSRRMRKVLEGRIARLPPRQRVAVEMIQREDMSLREIAESLGTTVTAVKLRAHRGYIALRTWMATGFRFERG